MSEPVKVDKLIALQDGPYIAMLSNGKKVAICRCGQSSSKPLCDGTHVSCDFQADATEVDLEK